MLKTILNISASTLLFMGTLFASESMLEREDACSQLSEQTQQLAHHTLPLVLQPFMCHEDMPGISNNVILKLTAAKFCLFRKLLIGLPYVSVIIIDEESYSTTATQGSQASEVSTVPVDSSQDSQDSQDSKDSLGSFSETQPFKPTS